MKIELYPNFNSVFVDDQLKGIFYPLCSVELEDEKNTKLFFVSSNGMWHNEEHSSEVNNAVFIQFKRVGNKYKFNGDIKLYSGHEVSKEIFELLEKDFEENGHEYLSQKMKTSGYVSQIKSNLNLPKSTTLDLDYFLQTFYEYAMNKLHYQQTNEFGAFRAVVDGWKRPDEKSPIVYEVDSGFEELEMNAEYLFPQNIKLSDYEKIGQVMGCEFFTDGNNTVLLYKEKEDMVLSVNQYS